jgi:hypothetical protein
LLFYSIKIIQKKKGRPVPGRELKELFAQILIQDTLQPPPQQKLFPMFPYCPQQFLFKGQKDEAARWPCWNEGLAPNFHLKRSQNMFAFGGLFKTSH